MRRLAGRIIPEYAQIPLLFCVIYNSLVYTGTMVLTRTWYHYDLTTDFDRAVPFVPAWIYVYLVCYIFWIVNYIMVSRVCDKDRFYRFITAELMAKTVCLVCYLLLPTTNLRPAVTGDGFASLLVKMVYAIDLPSNLFPSIHCLVSWMCWVGIRGNQKVPLAYRLFSLLFALAICASTQFTKQHYIADVIGGLAAAEGCWWLAARAGIWMRVQQIFTKINYRFGRASLE